MQYEVPHCVDPPISWNQFHQQHVLFTEIEHQLLLLFLLPRSLSTSFAASFATFFAIIILHTVVYQVIALGSHPSVSSITPLSLSIFGFLIAIAYPMTSLSPHDH